MKKKRITVLKLRVIKLFSVRFNFFFPFSFVSQIAHKNPHFASMHT